MKNQKRNNMEKLKFGIDVDGVLRDLVGGILNIYNSKFRTNIRREDFVHYDVKDQFPELPDAASYFFSGQIARILLCNSNPIPGSLNAFNLLSEIGTVYIVTSQYGYENISYTLNWLYNNGFRTDQICFVNDKSVVSGLDYFIDDNPKKFIGCKCKHGILIDMPYNRHDMTDIANQCHCEDFTRYANLEAFADSLVKSLNKGN